jgi:hypothetical protein
MPKISQARTKPKRLRLQIPRPLSRAERIHDPKEFVDLFEIPQDQGDITRYPESFLHVLMPRATQLERNPDGLIGVHQGFGGSALSPSQGRS